MTEQDIIRLAKQVGIGPDAAVAAFRAEHAAYAQRTPISEWQRANQEQATILMRLMRQNEINSQEGD